MSQPRVPPESLSWCVDQFSLAAWEGRGQILQKAHEIKVEGSGIASTHRPVCGAQVAHLTESCAPAPAGWPACRHCWSRKREVGVPAVFYGLGGSLEHRD